MEISAKNRDIAFKCLFVCFCDCLHIVVCFFDCVIVSGLADIILTRFKGSLRSKILVSEYSVMIPCCLVPSVKSKMRLIDMGNELKVF